jgi:hypothetical protein
VRGFVLTLLFLSGALALTPLVHAADAPPTAAATATKPALADKYGLKRAMSVPLEQVIPCARDEEFKPYVLLSPDGQTPVVFIICRQGQLSAQIPANVNTAATPTTPPAEVKP